MLIVLSAGLAGTALLFWAFEGGIFGGGGATPLWVYPALVYLTYFVVVASRQARPDLVIAWRAGGQACAGDG